MRAGGDNGPERAPPGSPRAARPIPRPRPRAPAGVAGLSHGLGPGAQLGGPLSLPCARTAGGAGAGLLDHSAPGDSRPGAGSAGQVTCIGPGWGLREARGAALPPTSVTAVARAWAGSRGGCGAPERERNFNVTSPTRLLPRGRRDTGTLSPSSLNPPGPLLPRCFPNPEALWLPPWLARAPLSPWKGLLGTCWPRRPA